MIFTRTRLLPGQSMPGGEPSTMTFSALEAEVKVEWQREGIVHIRAQSEADLFFAQGYVSSRLRLWEMEVQRHTVAGRLAEIVGERGVASDKLFRTLGAPRHFVFLRTPPDGGGLRSPCPLTRAGVPRMCRLWLCVVTYRAVQVGTPHCRRGHPVAQRVDPGGDPGIHPGCERLPGRHAPPRAPQPIRVLGPRAAAGAVEG
jgi:hypothetical protein